MTWLRAIFDRLSPSPAVSSTAWGQTIQRMAAADDPDERARLGKLLATQLEGYLSGQAGNTFVALLELEERIRAGQGETNDMIGEAVGLIRGQGAVLDAARADFRQVAETVSDLRLWRQEVDQERAAFRQSRDRSIEERQRHTELLAESAADRARLTADALRLTARDEALSQQITELSAQMERLSEALARREVDDAERR